MNSTDLKDDRNFHWLVKLGLWNQATIYCEEPTVEFEFYSAGTIITWLIANNVVDIFYVSSKIQT